MNLTVTYAACLMYELARPCTFTEKLEPLLHLYINYATLLVNYVKTYCI